MKNLLIENLPEKNKFGVPIRTDFRYWVQFIRALEDPALTDDMRLKYALESVYYKVDWDNFVELFEGAMDFLVLGRETKPEKSPQSGERLIDYDIDADKIITSFLQQYHFRILKEPMHWFEFRTYINGFVNETPMGAVMNIRAATYTADMTKAERKHLQKMKSIYSLGARGGVMPLSEDDFIKNVEERAAEIRKDREKLVEKN